MTITKEHILFSIHLAFHLKKNAAAMICAAYVENAVSHTKNHVKYGIKNFAKKISVLKMNRVLDPLKRLKRMYCKCNVPATKTEKSCLIWLADLVTGRVRFWREVLFQGSPAY